MDLKIKMSEGAKMPSYATPGSACFDIFAINAKRIADNVVEYGTGLFFEIPEGYVMKVYSRSGHGFRYQTRLTNCVGIIDSDYRGELKVQLIADLVFLDENEERETLKFDDFSKAIAQAEIVPVEQVTFKQVDSLSETQRGSNGFGSTS